MLAALFMRYAITLIQDSPPVHFSQKSEKKAFHKPKGEPSKQDEVILKTRKRLQ